MEWNKGIYYNWYLPPRPVFCRVDLRCTSRDMDRIYRLDAELILRKQHHFECLGLGVIEPFRIIDVLLIEPALLERKNDLITEFEFKDLMN